MHTLMSIFFFSSLSLSILSLIFSSPKQYQFLYPFLILFVFFHGFLELHFII
ncbi:hypothetical protein IC575_012431 [Cucumis melo]